MNTELFKMIMSDFAGKLYNNDLDILEVELRMRDLSSDDQQGRIAGMMLKRAAKEDRKKTFSDLIKLLKEYDDEG